MISHGQPDAQVVPLSDLPARWWRTHGGTAARIAAIKCEARARVLRGSELHFEKRPNPPPLYGWAIWTFRGGRFESRWGLVEGRNTANTFIRALNYLLAVRS